MERAEVKRYHRDSKRFVEENCKKCALIKNTLDCDCIFIAIGADLIESGEMPDAIPNKFYLYEVCPMFVSREE